MLALKVAVYGHPTHAQATCVTCGHLRNVTGTVRFTSRDGSIRYLIHLFFRYAKPAKLNVLPSTSSARAGLRISASGSTMGVPSAHAAAFSTSRYVHCLANGYLVIVSEITLPS
jgi:hypothetical protein